MNSTMRYHTLRNYKKRKHKTDTMDRSGKWGTSTSSARIMRLKRSR